MMLLRVCALQTETVLTSTAGVLISSHSPHSQHGSVFVTTTGGGVGWSSHSPHSQHGSVLVTMTGGGIDIDTPSSHPGHGPASAATLDKEQSKANDATVKNDILKEWRRETRYAGQIEVVHLQRCTGCAREVTWSLELRRSGLHISKPEDVNIIGLGGCISRM